MIRQALQHGALRMKALGEWPVGVVIVVVTGLAFLIVPVGIGRFAGCYSSFAFCFLLSMAISFAIRGNVCSSGTGGFEEFLLGAMPALPVGKRARTLGQAGAALLVIVAFQVLALLLMVLTGSREESIGRFASWCLASDAYVFPSLIVWSTPSSSTKEFALRAGVVAALFMVVSFLFSMNDPKEVILIGLLISVVAVLLIDIERVTLPFSKIFPIGSNHPVDVPRESGRPVQVYYFDIFKYVFRFLVPVYSAGIVVVALGFYVVDSTISGLGATIAAMFAAGAYSPLGSYLIWKSLGQNDRKLSLKFLSAMSCLPLSRAQVISGVYLHVLLVTLAGVAVRVLLAFAEVALDLFPAEKTIVPGEFSEWWIVFLPVALLMLPAAVISAVEGKKTISFILLAAMPILGMVTGFGVLADGDSFSLTVSLTISTALSLAAYLLTGTHRHARTLALELKAILGGRR